MTDVVSQIQRTLDGLRQAHHRAVRIGEIQLSAGDFGALEETWRLGMPPRGGLGVLTYIHTSDVLPIKENPAVQDGEVWVTVSFRR